MSTKESLAYEEFEKRIKFKFHIYKECLDGLYYLKTNKEKIELPEEIAKGFAKVLKNKKFGNYEVDGK